MSGVSVSLVMSGKWAFTCLVKWSSVLDAMASHLLAFDTIPRIERKRSILFHFFECGDGLTQRKPNKGERHRGRHGGQHDFAKGGGLSGFTCHRSLWV